MAEEEKPKKPVVAKLITPKPANGDYEVVEQKRTAEVDYDDDDDDDDDRPRNRRRRRRDDDDDDREEGDATGGLIPYKNAMALMAYYVGIFSFFLPVFGGVIAFVLGIKGFSYAKKHPKARGQVHAMIGIIAGTFTTLFWLGVIVLLAIGAFAK